MKQLSRLLLATLLFSLTIAVAHAASGLHQIKPDGKDVGGFAFTVKADRLKDGSLQLNVLITPTAETKFDSTLTTTALKSVKNTPNSWSVTGGRTLESKKTSSLITCVFSVSAKELADLDLSFVFIHEAGFFDKEKLVPIPSSEIYYARLTDYIKP